MSKRVLKKKRATKHVHTLWFLVPTALFCIFCLTLVTTIVRSQQASQTTQPTQSSRTSLNTSDIQPNATVFSTATQVSIQTTVAPVSTASQDTSSKQSGQGVFTLSTGGPIPVPESMLKPTNIAHVTLDSTLTSVYAGSMPSQPQTGILCVLRENTVTGAIRIKMYQGLQTGGALTILSIHNSIVKVSNSVRQGSFDLNTNTFQWE